MELKEYQARSLHWLRRFFEKHRALGDAGTAFYATTSEIYEGTGIPYQRVKELPGLPYVCLRIPTGGGKTLVGCHAIATANNYLLQTDHSLVIWLVPSDAIRQQTLGALKDRKHHYRQALESLLGSVTVLDIDEALFVQRATLDTETVVVVATMQAFRREDTASLKVYEANGSLMSHFTGVSDELLNAVERRADGSFDYSLVNVFRLRKPLLIVDEAHNARTGLSFVTLARLGPSCILELTATPTTQGTEDNPRSNVLYSVSAAELKAEQMIKLPIRLKARLNWKELLGEAIGVLNGLNKSADAERRESGEYIRPMMLLQAQPRRQNQETITVDVVEKCLIEDFKIAPEQIARATGEERGLEGVDVLSKDCPIRFIITVQALKEGWDCPFAYVLFSVAELQAARAIEQILGRIMRLPKARKKSRAELNVAYAFAASASFADAARALTDGLVENGFERQEARDLVTPLADVDLEKFELLDFAPRTVSVSVSETLAQPLPNALGEKVEFDPTTNTLKINAALSADEEKLIKASFASAQSHALITEACARARKQIATKSPAERGELFSVPVLAIKQGDFFEQFEETHIDDVGWNLLDFESSLSESDFSIAEAGETGLVDITDAGKLQASFLPDLDKQLALLSVDAAWSVARLVHWLDRSFAHPDVPPNDSGIFLTKLVTVLAESRGISLEQLTANRYKLAHAVERKITALRKEARTKTFQNVLLPELAVSDSARFAFPPDAYPYNTRYIGRKLERHYYPVVGEMKADGEEFECAAFIDKMPEVKFWVRNLAGPGRETTSFWIQTASDKFYPDFVCQLDDGRLLVVEYKNARDWSNDDSKEKRNLGELWAERSGGKCLFIMPKGLTELPKIAALARSN